MDAWRQAAALAADLKQVFTDRLRVRGGVWAPSRRRPGGPNQLPALVESLELDDLDECSRLAPPLGAGSTWRHRSSCRSHDPMGLDLDASPLEHNEILAHTSTPLGGDPFDGVTISRDDLAAPAKRRSRVTSCICARATSKPAGARRRSPTSSPPPRPHSPRCSSTSDG